MREPLAEAVMIRPVESSGDSAWSRNRRSTARCAGGSRAWIAAGIARRANRGRAARHDGTRSGPPAVARAAVISGRTRSACPASRPRLINPGITIPRATMTPVEGIKRLKPSRDGLKRCRANRGVRERCRCAMAIGLPPCVARCDEARVRAYHECPPVTHGCAA